MHKKLASDLTSLAHSILQMKNKDNVFLLQKKAHEIYEKLSVLAYVEEYINNTPGIKETKEELLAKIAEAEEQRTVKEENEEVTKKPIEPENVVDKFDDNEIKTTDFSDEITENVIEQTAKEIVEEPVIEEITEQPFDELEETIFGDNNDDDVKFDETKFIEDTMPTLEDELKDTIDVSANLFTKVTPRKSLNDRLQNTIQIGLNDRIAFVKHLFEGSSADFNRVVSQLNTFHSEKEAKKFINKTVKPDYDWSEKEEYEIRFLEIIERRFA